MKKIILGAILMSGILLSGCGQISTNKSGENASGVIADANTPNAKLATCIKDKGAVFYGTTRCSHCARQKELFADGKPFLPFVDCDKESAKCEAAGITGYPTWIFADGSKLQGAQEIATLSEKTGCK